MLPRWPLRFWRSRNAAGDRCAYRRRRPTPPPKWTMCAVNAKEELALALAHSVSAGNIEPEEATELRFQATRRRLEPPAEWTDNPEVLTAYATGHAINMGVPKALAFPMRSAAPQIPLHHA